MRIISGEWRGRTIVTPAGETTRPTADRARETLFSMLASRLGGFTGLIVADLFAGSGALGLEALSRGAARCTFIDHDRAAIGALRANVAALAADGATILQASALTPPRAASPCDLIFIDPPYGSIDFPTLLTAVAERGWIRAGTIVSIETGRGTPVDGAPLETIATRQVGKAELHLLRAS